VTETGQDDECYRLLSILKIVKPTRDAPTMAFMKALILFLLAAASGCLAQQVTVRVVNGKDGQSLNDEKVVIQFFGAKATTVQADASGETHFVVPNPTPDYVDVHVSLKSEHWHCDCWVYADPRRWCSRGSCNFQRQNGVNIQKKSPGNPEKLSLLRVPSRFSRGCYIRW
jgi:hypothetical protein